MSTIELRALLDLQDLDTHIALEEHRRASLPQRAELAQVERALMQLRSDHKGLCASRDEIAARQDLAERELKATEDRVAQVNARLYGGSVTASRELQAMAADVDGLKKRISDLEDRALALMDERDPLDARLAQLDDQERALGERRSVLLAELGAVEAGIDAALSSLRGQRPGRLATVPADLSATYERLRARLGGVAVARLVGGRCDGCHLALPAVELDRIRHHDAGTLEYCEQCGRILVVPGD